MDYMSILVLVGFVFGIGGIILYGIFNEDEARSGGEPLGVILSFIPLGGLIVFCVCMGLLYHQYYEKHKEGTELYFNIKQHLKLLPVYLAKEMRESVESVYKNYLVSKDKEFRDACILHMKHSLTKLQEIPLKKIQQTNAVCKRYIEEV